ncbi:MAG: class I SAM-dependent methyltransferase [Methanomicrobiales archaeon]|nr:class I SAM-dependent methyltransferase [Methanomicrobiales archaeon]
MGRGDEEYRKSLRGYYDSHSSVYDATYTGEGRYRSNHFRLQVTLNLLETEAPPPLRLLDAGCGNGRVLAEVMRRGYECRGIDSSRQMLAEARATLERNSHDPSVVEEGDIYDLSFPPGSFDVILCLGVLSNLPDHGRILRGFSRVLGRGGILIASMDNDLFSLYSRNEHTLQFLRTLWEGIGVPADARDRALSSLGSRPAVAGASKGKVMEDREIDKSGVEIPRYSPLNIHGSWAAFGFRVDAIRFYHYHPLPPAFEAEYPSLFREFAEGLETTDYDWRGAVLCNAMVVLARKA